MFSRLAPCLTILLLAGCGSSDIPGLFDFLKISDFENDRVEVFHSGDPIPAPYIPLELRDEALARKQAEETLKGKESRVNYRVMLSFIDTAPQGPLDFSTNIKAVDSAIKKASDTIAVAVPQSISDVFDNSVQGRIARAFTQASFLEKLSSYPPGDAAGLEQRLRSDLKIAREVLKSFGYYAGEVTGAVLPAASRERARNGDILPPAELAKSALQTARSPETGEFSYEVEISFTLGQLYTLGHSPILLVDADPDAAMAQKLPEGEKYRLPSSLADAGLAPGSPAEAEAVLDAVNRVRQTFQNRGFPFAAVTSSRYFADHAAYTLEAELRIESGPFTRMGELETRGDIPVREFYLKALQTWKSGEVWEQNRIDDYRELLRQSGLFAGVDLSASEKLDALGRRNVVARLLPAPERTVGGAVRYDTDLDFGVLGYWEHRNISRRGDKLRFELPLWEDLQEFAASYRLPFFLHADQDFVTNAGVLREDNDSYKMLSGSGSIGVERRFARHWISSARVRAEGGKLEETDKMERDYFMIGLPFSLAFNDTDSPLDARGGMRITLSPGPYTGYYNGSFTAARARLDANFFWSVMQRDRLVLAFRGSYGVLLMENASAVPPSIRFYSGGGGSVRGYAYRSIGPRNNDNDPLGGESLLEFSAETRIKFNDEWGMVFFADSGMVYNRDYPEVGGKLQWGGGAGLRYYTVLGPIRLDLATPLNPRSEDSLVQLYISIGQSF